MFQNCKLGGDHISEYCFTSLSLHSLNRKCLHYAYKIIAKIRIANFASVLSQSEMDLMFLTAALRVLCFALVARKVLGAHQSRAHTAPRMTLIISPHQ